VNLNAAQSLQSISCRAPLQVINVVLSLLAIALPLRAQESRWNELNSRLQDLFSHGNYAEATATAEEVLRVAETSFGAEDLRTATCTDTLAQLYYGAGKYVEAEPLFKRSLAVREKKLGPDDTAVAGSLNNLAELYRAQGKYADAEPLFKRSLGILERSPSPDPLQVATSLNNLAEVYRNQRKYSDAEPMFLRSLAIREKALGVNHPSLTFTLNNLAANDRAQRRNAEAKLLFNRSLTILEKALGPERIELVSTLNQLAELYRDEGKFSGAESLLRRSLDITEKTFGAEHPNVAASADNLARVCELEGKYTEAEQLFRRSVAIAEKALGSEHPAIGVGLNNLAALYMDEGKYAEAEPFFKRSLAIHEKSYGSENMYVASDLSNLAALYREQGKYDEAELLYRRCLAILEKVLGPDDRDVAKTLTNIARLDNLRLNFVDAEPLLQRSLAIYEKALGSHHPDLALSLDALAMTYMGELKFADAEPLLKRSLAVREEVLGPDHRDVARSLNNLALLYFVQGKYSEAEPLFKRSLTLNEAILGPDHPDVATTVDDLALLYYAQGNRSEAEVLFDRGLQNLSKQFETSFTYMSEKDRLRLLNTAPRFHFDLYFSFCTSNAGREPALASKMYDLLLWEKGLVGSSVAALRSQVAASGDAEAVMLFDRLAAMKSDSSHLATTRPAGWQDLQKKVDHEANDLEQQLARRISSFAEQKNLAHVSWRDVQQKLQPDEAAVEFVRFPFFDGKKWTSDFEYVALIVTRQTKDAPALISLGLANDLEADPLRDYRRRVGLLENRTARGVRVTTRNETLGAAPKATFYNAFWTPLEAALGGVTRVYLSPDGVLNQLSLGAVSDGNGQLLMEKYDLRIVSSTKDILRAPRKFASDTAVLIGNPLFDLDETRQRSTLRALRSHENPEAPLVATPKDFSAGTAMRSRDLAGAMLPALPGTQKEVEAISRLLEKRHWTVKSFTQASALKVMVLGVQAPRILHLATHGFFESDQQLKPQEPGSDQSSNLEDPMLRSGLYFAAANRRLSGTPTPVDLDDGILTAYETSSLNLQGTELVVLSACETGLGEVTAGEGVFGLRRALQVAGAESVLLSMWSVPDRETQELMTLFYEKWLTGKDKHEALRQAQLEMRARVESRYGKDLPQYWAAFVLVGR
jgi:CHAT domain-containing protein/Tfp pilus assembly protein PilF